MRYGSRSRRDVIGQGIGVAAGLAGLGGASVRRASAGSVGLGRRQQEPVEIEYWHINTQNFGLRTLQELIPRFQAANPGVTVTERYHDNGYTGLLENLQTALAAGRPPDVAQIGYLYQQYVTTTFPFTSTQALVDEYGPADFLGDFPDNVLDLGRVGDELVGLPYSISNMVVYYNAELLRQAGVDPEAPPHDWAAWAEAARAVRDETGKPGFFMGTTDNWAT